MSLSALREAIDLLIRVPALWLSGLICGMLGAALWIVLNIYGTFFSGRLVILFSLAGLFFICGMLASVKKNGSTIPEMLSDSTSYYFKILVPTLVIASGILLVFVMVVLTLALFGIQPDPGLFTFLVFGILMPTMILSFFYDTAVIFDDRKVFESLQRSIEVVTAHLADVILFFFGCLLIVISVAFPLLVIWILMLADRLEPITLYNETQVRAITHDQLTAIIGIEGVLVTALVIFIGIAVLIPLLYTYKACFYRQISRTAPIIRQQVGEYDSKGRWYKY